MRRSLPGLLALAFVVTTVSDAAEKRVPPPSLAQLGAVWVGGQLCSTLELLRLEIDEHGVGLLTVQWLPGKPAQAYRVSRTNLKDYDIEFVVQPIDPDAAPMHLRGRATRGLLDLQAGGKNPDWERRFVFEPLADLTARLDSVNQRAERFRSTVK